jgi:3-methylcrotonyl-CoA carboxylase alpha subunit
MSDDLSPSQAAARIGVATRTVQRWIERGHLPARRVGGRYHVASGAIDAFVAATGGSRPPPPHRPAIETLFIANRGEIATRIERTCEHLGILAIVPTTDGPARLDLLDAGAVVAAARNAGADALHPGFGFLAENAEFAEAVAAAGIIWIGPPPRAIRAMGDKAAARILAASLGIPVLHGYDGDDQSDDALSKAADAIGYPILVKPTAGGGGKGMRIMRDAAGLIDALAGARRESAAAFADQRLILERLVENARHVEIQVLFDAAGTGIQLGERDCSVQRRHQKVLEEAPSPAISPSLRDRLGEAALTLARSVGYVGAGTCEFLVDDRGEPAFLEMNTRLQVEHPVTELVTGRDLVADQIHIAAGGRIDQAPSRMSTGHAIEVRLYGEDAEDGFLPATGRIEALRWPAGDGIRVDAGIELGDEVGARFDPMLAKIIAWGPDRPSALARLTEALDDTVVLGLVTNLRFLRWLVREPVVAAGDVRTDTLERIWPPDDWSGRVAIPEAAWSAAAAALAGGGDAWLGGWRLNASPSVRMAAEGGVRTASVAPLTGDDPATFAAVRDGDTVHLDLAGRSVPFRLADAPDVDGTARAAAVHGVTGATGPIELLAPMPGSVIRVHVALGAAVEPGDPIVTLEAMKMEHAVTATSAGQVGDLRVRPGDQVSRRQHLATIEP